VIVTHGFAVGRRRLARNDPAKPIANGFFELQLNASEIGRHLTLYGSTIFSHVANWQTKEAATDSTWISFRGVSGGAVNETNSCCAHC
jgi:hypothetical protein